MDEPSAVTSADVFSIASYVGGYAVVINTRNPTLDASFIQQAHHNGLKVYGWRWPATRIDHRAPHYYAIEEAEYVTTQLIPVGLDGYIVDPEADRDARASNYWNKAGLEDLAVQFCATIRNAAPAGFKLGLTSGCNFPDPKVRPLIPWSAFLQFCDAAYPQAYWNNGKPIHGGTPESAFRESVTSWKRVVPFGKPIIPMAGVLLHIAADEIELFANLCANTKSGELHFYAVNPGVTREKYTRIRELFETQQRANPEA